MGELRHRISEGALMVGYAMSRFDTRVFDILGCNTWEEAFKKSAAILGEKPKSIKALRDEFDPFFDNKRKGWDSRPPRPPLVALMHEMGNLSDSAVQALVEDVLSNGQLAVEAVSEVVNTAPTHMEQVARRLRTGVMAERFFLDHCYDLVRHRIDEIRDTRADACGFDFALVQREVPVFEVKGLSEKTGNLLFTDLEWQTAKRLRSNYWVIVVAGMDTSPTPTVIHDPLEKLVATIQVQQRPSVSWTAPFRG